MADFVQRENEYPRLPDVPELIHKSSPYPFMLYVQADSEYPRIAGLPEVVPIEPPTPYLLYMQNVKVNNGYPYIDTPKMYKIFSKPLPFLFFKPNTSKRQEFKIIIDNAPNHIVVQSYRQTIEVK